MKKLSILCGILLTLQVFAETSSNDVDQGVKILDRYPEYYKDGITVIQDEKRGNICYVFRMGGGVGGISCLPVKQESKEND